MNEPWLAHKFQVYNCMMCKSRTVDPSKVCRDCKCTPMSRLRPRSRRVAKVLEIGALEIKPFEHIGSKYKKSVRYRRPDYDGGKMVMFGGTGFGGFGGTEHRTPGLSLHGL